VPAVPLTSVGKLDRKKLRQWIADGSAASLSASVSRCYRRCYRLGWPLLG
jgi:hypothetical protein